MHSLFRVSIALSHLWKPNKQSIPCNLKHFYHLLYMIHTVTPKISLPDSDRDYSASSYVARSNWLITSLCREGKINDARQLFDKMHERDVVTWTTVITGYIKCRLIGEAKRLFDRADAIKNVVTWTAMLNGYVRRNQIMEAERLFEVMPVKNVVSWNTMIDGYVRNGEVDKAVDLFKRMPERNVVSWNTVITALAQRGTVEEARRLFDDMPKRDVISWTTMVTGLARNGRVDEAREVFERMPDRNVVSWNAMITGYAKNMRLVEAFELFQRMPQRDLPSWNTMITGFIQNGELEQARKVFDDMPEKNVVSWTTMITGYVQKGENETALKIFAEMLRDGGVKPNDGTFVNILGACSDLAGLGEGEQVHQMITKTIYQNMAFVVSALINMYSKCGALATATKMFNDGTVKDLVSWNCMIAAYAHHGCGTEAMRLFTEMRNLGFKPNDISYVGLLSACSYAGLVEEGLLYFDELVKDKTIQVREDHYTCLVDLCGRAGRLKEALNIIQQLGSKASSSMWGALLAGCNVHGNLDIGKTAAKELLRKEPENVGTYLMLRNIYASSGKWKEAEREWLKMKDQRLKKQPGCSWIQVENRVNVFLAGDKSHPQSHLIYSLLWVLYARMNKFELALEKNDFIVEN
ncbi:pentatricopeptide repeat-containing protein At2g35030, mitochondrial [Euphorbia lathyris]|uniref:pentatricopeptide repeat-containing protein At2g35030, mitochondrial n=1 Tax=Euphorbia lathyris TaxID=212925 RepID=UPI0033143126